MEQFFGIVLILACMSAIKITFMILRRWRPIEQNTDPPVIDD